MLMGTPRGADCDRQQTDLSGYISNVIQNMLMTGIIQHKTQLPIPN